MNIRLLTMLLVVSVLTGFGLDNASAQAPSQWDYLLYNLILQQQSENDAQQTEINALQAVLATAQADISTLQSDLTAAEADISTLQSDLTAAEADIGDLQTQFTPLQNLVAFAPFVEVNAGTINGLNGPHIIFDGVNVHVRSGSGATDASVNGPGNLLVGYNEVPVRWDDNRPGRLAQLDCGHGESILQLWRVCCRKIQQY